MKCSACDEVQLLKDDITSSGGEGIIIREFGSPYIPGANTSLIKLKVAPISLFNNYLTL